MEARVKLKKRLIRLSILAAIIIFVAFSLPKITHLINRHSFSPERIEKVLAKKSNDLESRLDKLSSGEYISGEEGEALFYENGKAYFKFTGDSLSWWSTDAVPPPDSAFSSTAEQGLMFVANAYYIAKEIVQENERWVGLYLVYHDFPYQNKYLPRSFNKDFNLPDESRISFEPGTVNVDSPEGNFLFSVYNSDPTPERIPELINVFLWLTAFILILLILYIAYVYLITFRYRQVLIILGFTIDALIIRGILLYFKFPEALYDLDLFQPHHFASSFFCPSLGDLLLNAVTFLSIAWVFAIHMARIRHGTLHPRWKAIFMHGATQIALFILFIIAIRALESLVINSSINFDLNNLLALNEYSLAGFLTAFLIFLAFFLVAYRSTSLTVSRNADPAAYFLISLTILLTLIVVPMELVMRLSYGLFIILMIAYWVHHRQSKRSSLLGNAIVFLLIFSAILTLTLEFSLREREREKRKLMVSHLIHQRDRVAEYLFSDIRKTIFADTVISNIIYEAPANEVDQVMQEYIQSQYMRGYFQRFDMNVTVCAQGRLLDIQPGGYIVDCEAYFSGMINDLGKESSTKDLYFIDIGGENSNYLAVFQDTTGPVPTNIYLEFFPKHIPRGLGYPELLIDEKWMRDEMSEYAYAIYRNGELIRRVGNYFFSLNSENYTSRFEDDSFFPENDYDHYLKIIDGQSLVILSKPLKTRLDAIAPFSYLLVFAALLLILFYVFNAGRWTGISSGLNLRTRLQFSMVAVILISFIIIAATSLWFLVKTNENKNQDILSEKAHSVLVEIEHKMASQASLGPEQREWMESLLTKFSLVFFSDINMYAPDGLLLASSRSRIFDEGLIGEQMNAKAWEKLHKEGQSLVLLEERIGNYPYLSAYIPFRNDRNELLAYLNLPYFARQAELRQEISDFMVAIINIYVVLIALTLGAALFISNLFTSPLQLIRDKIRRVRLGSANEKIEWHRKDEIGTLVEEYNRMVDELADSAEALVKSERELAWREMARQVAHEIKNPLTPMKLNVQYLQRAWDDNAPDWDVRLRRFTSTLSEQIDTLSDIATAFSDFARMPANDNEPTELSQIAQSAIETYREGNPQKIQEVWDHQKTFRIFADRKQVLRVFNNLIKNALQALEDKHDGVVAVEIREQGGHYLVSIADNGPGIAEEKKDKIFIPNFTTKSSGMGLGLAMARNIVVAHGGRIWYETEEGRGTIFHFTVPVYDPKQ